MSAKNKKNLKPETQTDGIERPRCPHCNRLMPKAKILDPEKRTKLEEQLAKLAEREAKLKARLGIVDETNDETNDEAVEIKLSA